MHHQCQSFLMNHPQIIIMSAVQPRLSPLLGESYRENDYSPAFHSMVNRVVSKIYHKRGRRRPILASNALLCLAEEEKTESVTLTHFLFNSNRKNSPKSPGFLMTPRKSRDKLFKRLQEKYRQSAPSIEKRFTRTQYNQRVQTEPHSSYSLKLYEKMSQSNQCLVTKTFKFQQKNRHVADLVPQFTHQQQTSTTSPVLRRKMQNWTTRQSKICPHRQSKPPLKLAHEGFRSASLPIAFKNQLRGWQTKQADQFAF